MVNRIGLITLLVLVSTNVSAKTEVHPTFTLIESFTPHTAITRAKYATDYYTNIGGSIDVVINEKITISPGYQFGIDVIDNQTATYSDPTLTLGYMFTPKVEERFKFATLWANAGGYHSELYGLGTHIIPNALLEMEFTPQFFIDTINTKQISLIADFDVTLTKLIQINTGGAIGRTYVSHLRNFMSYVANGGITVMPKDHLKVFLSVAFAHGLNTDSPYSIINSTSTVNTQTGTRIIDPGSTALDPNGNTININVGTSLDF